MIEAVRDESMEQFEHFIENAAPDQMLRLTDLTLSDDDLAWINNQLLTLVKDVDGISTPMFYGEIKTDHILLIRDKV